MITTTPTNGVHHEADEAIDSLYSWFPPQASAPPPCPEAVFSLTLRGHLDGIETLLTVRGMTRAEFQTNVASVRGLLDAVPATAQASSTGEGWCSKHGLQMTQTHKDGRSWYSHRLPDGQWCKGK
jgi:hypothetical protein